MAQDYGTSGGRIPRKTIYMRETAAYIRPTTLAEVATLLGTGTKFGRFDDKTKKNSLKKATVRDVDDGNIFVGEWIGSVEGQLLNTTDANADDFETNFEGKCLDVILDDEVNKEIKVFKNITIYGEEDEVDGDKDVLLLAGTKKASTKALIRDRFSYAAFI